MNLSFLPFETKTGALLIRVSVFAFLMINCAFAQQWETSSDLPSTQDVPPVPVFDAAKKVNYNPQNKKIQMKRVMEQPNAYQKDEGKIQLSMKDFKISKNLSGITSCSMNFFVLSTVSSPVSSISFRLKWPDLEAPVSFEGVRPNQSSFRTHAFAGDVCYTLDKTPNVIVNRCRIKGMTQQDCANRIEWVK